MLLANLSKSSSLARLLTLKRALVPALSPSPLALDQLIDLFNLGANGKYNAAANFDYLAYVFADLAKVFLPGSLFFLFSLDLLRLPETTPLHSTDRFQLTSPPKIAFVHKPPRPHPPISRTSSSTHKTPPVNHPSVSPAPHRYYPPSQKPHPDHYFISLSSPTPRLNSPIPPSPTLRAAFSLLLHRRGSRQNAA